MLWSKSDRIERSIDHFYFSDQWTSDWSLFWNDQWTSDWSVFSDQTTSLGLTDGLILLFLLENMVMF
jgi:hypothetical protein